MSANNRLSKDPKTNFRGSTMSYTVGFLMSVVLTVIPFYLVVNEVFRDWTLIFVLLGFATVQLAVQLILFLHLGNEPKPRWNSVAFWFAAFIVLVLVIGSLWIMSNLDYHTMTPTETNQYIIEEEAIYRE